MPQEDEPLCYVFVPALLATLIHGEREKGSPLTEEEVIVIRDKAPCIVLRTSIALELEEKRGYPDLEPSHVWQQWQEFRARQSAVSAEKKGTSLFSKQ